LQNQSYAKELPQCACFNKLECFRNIQFTEVFDARAMSYGTFADGQICAQYYVTLLHVCISCHGHLNSLHQPTSTAPGLFLHSFALLKSNLKS